MFQAVGVQGWRSGESTCLPPMWPGFDSQTGSIPRLGDSASYVGWVCWFSTLHREVFYGGPQGQNTTQYWAGYTTIFRDTKQFFTVHNNLSRYRTIFHSTQQSFATQNNFSRYTTIFRDTKQFFTKQNNLLWYKTPNSVPRCKTKIWKTGNKHGQLYITCHTTTCW